MGLFYRSFAFSNEPSNLAYFLLLTLPFVYIYYPLKYSVIIMLGILPTFSASAFSLFFVGLMMGLVISVFKTSGLIRVKNLLLLTCVVPSILFFVSTIPVFSKIISKLLLSNQVGSVNARWERVALSLDKFSESPFVGMGPGYWSSTFGVSPNNIYMLVASEIGIFGLVLFLLFLFWVSFIQGPRLLRADSVGIYLVIVGLGFGFFTAVSYSMVGLVFIVFYNRACRLV